MAWPSAEAWMGFEPTYDGFANRCLTAWLPRRDLRPGRRFVPRMGLRVKVDRQRVPGQQGLALRQLGASTVHVQYSRPLYVHEQVVPTHFAAHSLLPLS